MLHQSSLEHGNDYILSRVLYEDGAEIRDVVIDSVAAPLVTLCISAVVSLGEFSARGTGWSFKSPD